MEYYSYKYTILVVFMKEKYLKLSSRRCLGMMMIQKKALLSKDLPNLKMAEPMGLEPTISSVTG
jgi:hypothetical protein